MSSEKQTLVERFRRARRDPGRAVLEGFHALKHALRFGAALEEVVAVDPETLQALAAELAPDVGAAIRRRLRVVPEDVFRDLAPHPPSTGVIALARRPAVDVPQVLAASGPAPVVLLEDPRHLGNVGAAVRVAAAAGAAALLTTGEHDPWHPAALRGGAGLHYALPVARVEGIPATDRPVVALDPEGEELRAGGVPDRAVLVFGSERHGLSAGMLERADRRIAIPMRPGVSSLNLATSVAVALYAWRLGA